MPTIPNKTNSKCNISFSNLTRYLGTYVLFMRLIEKEGTGYFWRIYVLVSDLAN